MSPSQVRQIIENEIKNNWTHSNAHGVDLRTNLLSPERKTFLDPMDNSKKIDLWLVLEENLETCGGYKIVFDEERNEFGLATRDQHGRDLFLGFYGTFIEAFDAM
jgi:hypothetical protein